MTPRNEAFLDEAYAIAVFRAMTPPAGGLDG